MPASVTVPAGIGACPSGFASRLLRTTAWPGCLPVISTQRLGAQTALPAQCRVSCVPRVKSLSMLGHQTLTDQSMLELRILTSQSMLEHQILTIQSMLEHQTLTVQSMLEYQILTVQSMLEHQTLKSQSMLGFKPQTSLDQGLNKFLEWYLYHLSKVRWVVHACVNSKFQAPD
jgi:hypothetical protein